MFYSATQNCWFDPAYRDKYEKRGAWPDDAVEYPMQVFDELVINRPTDKIMVPDASGVPVLADPPPPSIDDIAAIARADRDARIQAVAWRYERNAREQRLGIPPSDDIATLDAYVQALADLPKQKGFPAKIKWPTL